MLKHLLCSMVLISMLPSAARADGGMQLPGITHEAMKAECGACHMVYQPQWLPQRSWEALMAGLDDHFGEVATLPPEVNADILAYLMEYAADAPGSRFGKRLLRRVKPDDTPIRITELPYWKSAHDEVSQGAYLRPKVKTKGNCVACHGPGAATGYFAED